MWLPICVSDYWARFVKHVWGFADAYDALDDMTCTWWKHDEDKRDRPTRLFERLIKKSSRWKRDAVRLRVNRYLSRRVARYTVGNNGSVSINPLTVSIFTSIVRQITSFAPSDSCAPITRMRKYGQKRVQKQRIRLFASLTNYTILNGSRKNGERDSVAYVPWCQVMRSRVIIAASSLHAVNVRWPMVVISFSTRMAINNCLQYRWR